MFPLCTKMLSVLDNGQQSLARKESWNSLAMITSLPAWVEISLWTSTFPEAPLSTFSINTYKLIRTFTEVRNLSQLKSFNKLTDNTNWAKAILHLATVEKLFWDSNIVSVCPARFTNNLLGAAVLRTAYIWLEQNSTWQMYVDMTKVRSPIVTVCHIPSSNL